MSQEPMMHKGRPHPVEIYPQPNTLSNFLHQQQPSNAWSHVEDIDERRKVQNRLAQRRYRMSHGPAACTGTRDAHWLTIIQRKQTSKQGLVQRTHNRCYGRQFQYYPRCTTTGYIISAAGAAMDTALARPLTSEQQLHPRTVSR